MLNPRVLNVLKSTRKITSVPYMRAETRNISKGRPSNTNLLLAKPNTLPSFSLSTQKIRNYSTQAEQQPTSFDVVDADDFRKRVLSCKLPVIVDFQADWCGPCKQLGPLLESTVQSKDGKVLLAKVDVDDNAEIAMEYDVTAVPTVVALLEGNILGRFMGVKSQIELNAFIDKVIEGN